MGPAIAKYTKPQRTQDDIGDITTITIETSSGAGGSHKIDITKVSDDVATTASPTTSDSTNRIKDLDPEYHWIPPENYTQNIKEHVAEEISKKLTNYNRTENKNTVLDNNVFIDLILNSLLINTTGNSEEYTTIKSNIDRETTKIGENNDSCDEFLSSSTTVSNTFQAVETTSISTNEVTNQVEVITQVEIETISSTESTQLTEATTYYDTHKASQNHDSSDKEVLEYATTITSPDTFTDYISDTTRSKNKKKSYLQDSKEDYFDVTTEKLLSTESTDFKNSVTESNENTISEISTEKNLLKENNFTEVTEPSISNMETSTGYLYNKLDNTQENLKVNGIETLTTESAELNQKLIPTVTLKENNESGSYSSTTESDWNVKVATEQNTSTKSPDLKENNITVQPDSKDNPESEDYLSTKSPDFNNYTKIEHYLTENEPNPKAQSETENIEAESFSTKEDTSLAPSSMSPEQVVVYV